MASHEPAGGWYDDAHLTRAWRDADEADDRWFDVTITDSILRNKRTARQQFFTVRAENKTQAVVILKREYPTAFNYMKSVHVYPTTNPRVLCMGQRRVSPQQAEEAYQRAAEAVGV